MQKKYFGIIKIPANLKGSMIESYNVERESEAEMLLQRGTNLLIKMLDMIKIITGGSLKLF